jgi:hypothetical protein
MKHMRKLPPVLFFALLSFPTQMLAHGSEEEHQKEVLWTNVLFYGTLGLFVLLFLTFLFARKKVNTLKNAKGKEARERRSQLSKAVKGLKWASVVAFAAVVLSGIVLVGNLQGERIAEPVSLKEVSIDHAHGMSYSPDGNKLFFAVHDGLRVYENGQWILPAGEKHDYMGFSMVDDGFYSSGHPIRGSNKKNPLGIIKSTDEGKSFETLALYGEIDFHGMSVGYNSHAMYVFNPSPNQEMRETGLHYSTDEAKTWTQSKVSGLEGDPSAITAHPTNESIVAVGTNKGVYISKDYGNQFEKFGPPMQASSLFFSVEGELYAAGLSPQPVLVRTNLESNESQYLNIPEMTEDAIAFIGQSPVHNQQLSIMTFNNDVYISADSGANWATIVEQGKGTSETK